MGGFFNIALPLLPKAITANSLRKGGGTKLDYEAQAL